MRSDVTIPLPGGGGLDGVLALPAGTCEMGWPGVIVLHEVFGPQPGRGRPGRITAAVEASRAWLAARPEIDGERLAIIGFCMGGGFALTYAAGSPPGLRAAAVNYGQVPADAELLRGVCPVVASYGGRDRIVGPHGERLRKHLSRLGVEHDVKTYPDAGHSFMTAGHHPIGRLVFLPMRLGYEPRAAEDAWARVFAFFDGHIEPSRTSGGALK